jgi:WbqC-like protein family
MKLAIMQPYFFPYLGYFQLINAVDKFVIYDDVQYIKGGWINNNRILINGKSSNIVIPVRKDSIKKKINERYFVGDSLKFKIKTLKQIENSYKRAPFFESIYPEISRLLLFEEENVSEYNTRVIINLASFLDISTEFQISSETEKLNCYSAEGRVIDINQKMGSNVYINASGGAELYKKESFLNEGIELKFLITDKYFYKQFNSVFIPDLSIIDLLMFNSPASVKLFLNNYHLV